MATEQSLFGATPEAIQQAREAALNTQAAQYAQMDPFQQASFGIYKGANQLGGAVGGMLGGQDPQLAKASAMKQLASQSDTTTPEGLQQYARALAGAGFNQEALQAAQASQAGQLQAAQLGKVQAEQSKLELAGKQELALRDELSKLGPNPSQDAILATVVKYGSPDKVLAVVQGASDKEAARVQALSLAQQANDAKIEAARQRGEDQKVIAQMQIDGRLQIAQLAAALKQSIAGNKPLPASLQRDEGKDLETIDTYAAQQAALAPAIASLTPNKQGIRKLELGPVKNAMYMAQNASGNSTDESNAYAKLRSAVDTAVNLQVSAEKGVQTDKDVLRFAQALVAAYGKNDSRATFNALTDYTKALATAETKTKARLESRRKSQNVEPYGFQPSSSLGTASNPIKLD